MRKTFKYRLYPTPKQVEILQAWLGICREIYNAGLQERRTAWKQFGRSVCLSVQKVQLLGLKQDIPPADRAPSSSGTARSAASPNPGLRQRYPGPW
ncbi:MAG: helix-turn-helix domain-containing protein [Candidatus Bipolaricaulia bacterium]